MLGPHLLGREPRLKDQAQQQDRFNRLCPLAGQILLHRKGYSIPDKVRVVQ